MQKMIDELKELLEYDTREYPKWRGNIGHFNIDDDAVIITSSLADPKEGCNAERLQIMPARNGGISLSGYDERNRPIEQVLNEIDMRFAIQRVLAGARTGHRSVEWFANDLIRANFEVSIPPAKPSALGCEPLKAAFQGPTSFLAIA